MVMKRGVNIGEFKRHMGAYMRRVRRGERVVLFDRDRPIADIVPHAPPDAGLVVVPPTKSWEGYRPPRIRLKKVTPGRDALTALDEIRDDR